MKCDYEALEMFVYRSIEEGVPTTVVARVYGLDHDMIRECAKLVRVHRYGTDDLVDYTAQLQWDALEEAKKIMQFGLPAERGRFAAAVLGKTLAIQGRRAPERLVEAQEQIRGLFASMRAESPGSIEDEGPTPRFVAFADDDLEETRTPEDAEVP